MVGPAAAPQLLSGLGPSRTGQGAVPDTHPSWDLQGGWPLAGGTQDRPWRGRAEAAALQAALTAQLEPAALRPLISEATVLRPASGFSGTP